MSGYCDFCGVWHSGMCCHPKRIEFDALRDERDAAIRQRDNWHESTDELLTQREQLRAEVASLRSKHLHDLELLCAAAERSLAVPREPVAWIHPLQLINEYYGYTSPVCTFEVQGWIPLYDAAQRSTSGGVEMQTRLHEGLAGEAPCRDSVQKDGSCLLAESNARAGVAPGPLTPTAQDVDAMVARFVDSHCDTCDVRLLYESDDVQCSCGHSAAAALLTQLRDERDAARAERERLRVDAERWNAVAVLATAFVHLTFYQNEHGTWTLRGEEGVDCRDYEWTGETPDAAIDAARAK